MKNEGTNYATKRHKTHNRTSIVKLFNFKKLQFIIMHNCENYFYLFTLCFNVNEKSYGIIVYSLTACVDFFNIEIFLITEFFQKNKYLELFAFLLA